MGTTPDTLYILQTTTKSGIKHYLLKTIAPCRLDMLIAKLCVDHQTFGRLCHNIFCYIDIGQLGEDDGKCYHYIKRNFPAVTTHISGITEL